MNTNSVFSSELCETYFSTFLLIKHFEICHLGPTTMKFQDLTLLTPSTKKKKKKKKKTLKTRKILAKWTTENVIKI